MKKKDIPWILATIRAVTFVPIVLSTFNLLPVTLIQQLLGTTIIMGSDIFDGKISRKYNNEKDKLRFRIFDTTIDKTGIFSCIIGLLSTGKISIPYASLLIGYNSILLGGGLLNLVTTKEKKEKTVQGLSISRWFTALTGASIILLNNISLGYIPEALLTIGMTTLGVSSLTIQAKDKLKQNKEIVKTNTRVQENTTNGEKEKVKEKTKEPTIEELKELRNILTNTPVEEKPKVYTKKTNN